MSRPDYRVHFLLGVEHFNAGRFWHAHESWETLWLAATSDTGRFLQGLIQIAAAYHHLQRGTLRGAVRLIDAGLLKLEPFRAGYSGVDRSVVESASRTHRKWAADLLARGGEARLDVEDYPKLVVLDRQSDSMPPHHDW
jgi:hypothetical protein